MIVRQASSAYLDSATRLRLDSSRNALNKVFPDHWSFMLGEISMYCFMALVATGTYLTFFYDDSDHHVIYNGPYASLIGRSVPASYASVLKLSFATPDGLLIRQMHHWAALLFMGAIIFHMCRIFFTGAFRKPREMNWVFGLTLLVMGMAEGFTGYSLPGDLLSGAGLRIAYSVAQSIPIVGTWAAFIVFGGPFPTEVMTSRLYIIHVFLLPLTIIGLMTAHLSILWRQHHTQFRGSKRTETNVIGSTLYPYYAMKSIGLLVATFAVLAFLGGFFTINPIWIYGPFDPWTVSSPSAPDWYVAWLDGIVRLGPSWAIVLFGHTIPPLFFSAIVPPGILFAGLYGWPWIEKLFTKGDNQRAQLARHAVRQAVAAGAGRRGHHVRNGPRLRVERRRAGRVPAHPRRDADADVSGHDDRTCRSRSD